MTWRRCQESPHPCAVRRKPDAGCPLQEPVEPGHGILYECGKLAGEVADLGTEERSKQDHDESDRENRRHQHHRRGRGAAQALTLRAVDERVEDVGENQRQNEGRQDPTYGTDEPQRREEAEHCNEPAVGVAAVERRKQVDEHEDRMSGPSTGLSPPKRGRGTAPT